jgi:hypothetical protein
VLKVDPDHLALTQVGVIDVNGELTCLALGPDDRVWAGIQRGSQTFLGYGSSQEPFARLETIDLSERKSAVVVSFSRRGVVLS